MYVRFSFNVIVLEFWILHLNKRLVACSKAPVYSEQAKLCSFFALPKAGSGGPIRQIDRAVNKGRTTLRRSDVQICIKQINMQKVLPMIYNCGLASLEARISIFSSWINWTIYYLILVRDGASYRSSHHQMILVCFCKKKKSLKCRRAFFVY